MLAGIFGQELKDIPRPNRDQILRDQYAAQFSDLVEDLPLEDIQMLLNVGHALATAHRLQQVDR